MDFKKKVEECFGPLLDKYEVKPSDGIEAKCWPDGTAEGRVWFELTDKNTGAAAEIEVHLVGTHNVDMRRDGWNWDRYSFELWTDLAQFTDKDENFPMEDEDALLAAVEKASEYAEVESAFAD